jgi:hypothetical protein
MPVTVRPAEERLAQPLRSQAMGSFIANLHVKSADSTSIARLLENIGVAAGYVTAPGNGWVSVFEEQLSCQDEDWISQLGSQISRDLGAPVVAFLIHDSDFLRYWLFDAGQVADAFDSCPGYFSDFESSSTTPPAVATLPHARTLKQVLRLSASEESIDAVLQQTPTFAETQLEELASLLEIDSQRALLDFDHLQSDYGLIPNELQRVGRQPDPSSRKPQAPALRLFRPDDESGTASAVAQQLDQLLGDFQASIRPTSTAPATPGSSIDESIGRLIDAAAAGDAQTVADLIGSGIDLEQTSPRLMPTVELTQLLAAIMHKQLPMVRQLLAAGARIDRVHPTLGTALHLAVSAGAADIVAALLQAGADRDARNAVGQTPLDALRAFKPMLGKLDLFKNIGLSLPSLQKIEQALPLAAWEECERLLAGPQP